MIVVDTFSLQDVGWAVMDDFIAWLNFETERQGISLQQVARQLGVSRIDIARIARGQASPSVDLCRRVAIVFDVSPAEVFRHAGFDSLESEEISVMQEITCLGG